MVLEVNPFEPHLTDRDEFLVNLEYEIKRIRAQRQKDAYRMRDAVKSLQLMSQSLQSYTKKIESPIQG